MPVVAKWLLLTWLMPTHQHTLTGMVASIAAILYHNFLDGSTDGGCFRSEAELSVSLLQLDGNQLL